MIICDLEHLEVVGEESRIEGGVQLVSGSSASSSGAATDGSVSTSNNSSSSASQQPFVIFRFPFGFPTVVGTITQTSANAGASGSTSSFFF
jgi:hypothetical protein